jgi:Na+-transporting methylmalonyl-CoA/oxaloacetate decarboxylase gamma subunit
MVVELLVVGLVLAVLAVLARRVWVIAHREEEQSISEEQARKNAAPLSTAILSADRRERKQF